MKPFSPRILIIDDDSTNCELIQLMLKYSNPNYEITSVLTPREGLSLAATQRFDLHVLDYRLRGITGLEVCRALRQTHADSRIMFFTGETHDHERQKAMQAGADAYLIKPDNLKNLTETAKRLLDIDKPAATQRVPLKAHRSEMSI
jgi:two-component system, OmpR family, response regulator